MPLPLNIDACYSALASRDARFDGQFFVAVKTTGIYCRPICRVRLPAQKNCSFFHTAAAAESNGYRPCLRCRPELTTGWCTENISESLAAQALLLFDQSFADDNVIASVSAQLGVSERHLRRLMQDHVGVTPSQYVQTTRLLFAKQLLTDTTVPIGELAFIVGFGSVRRFNTTFKTEYGFTPSELRGKKKSSSSTAVYSHDRAASGSVVCRIDAIAPYDFDAMLAFHSRRAVASVEEVNKGEYKRSIRIDEGGDDGDRCVGWYCVRAISASQFELEVSRPLIKHLARVIAIVRAQFDFNANPNHWLDTLGSLALKNPGLRVPGGVDGFEIAVRAILGQQVSVEAATTLVNRIVLKFGDAAGEGGPPKVFPQAKTLARCRLSSLGKLGVIETRARSIQTLARGLAAGEIDLSVAADVDAARTALLSIPGIGSWTSNYVLMRALRWPDAFVDNDLGIRKAAQHLGIDNVAEYAERWRPWRGYAAMHLWQHLSKEN